MRVYCPLTPAFARLPALARGLFWELLRASASEGGVIPRHAGESAADAVMAMLREDRRSVRQFESLLDDLERIGSISVQDDAVLIPSFTKYQAKLGVNSGRVDTHSPANPSESLDRAEKSSGQTDRKTEEITTVFDYWRRVMDHPRAHLDGSRRRAIERGLKSYGLETCLRAIDGCRASPFHMGDNDRKRRYDGLDLIFRNSEKTEAFLALAVAKEPAITPEQRRAEILERVRADAAKRAAALEAASRPPEDA